jgi:RNA polymerase sigma-70 factor (ECF subfamily)
MSDPGDDASLVARCQQGDRSAFDALVLRHQQEVFAVALRMLGDRDEAQDVAQDAFVRAYQGLGAFRQEAKLSTWLVSITMNLCRNRRRWWARRKRVIVASIDERTDTGEGSIGHDAVDPAPSPAVAVEQRERGEQLLEALQLLSDGERTVIVLRDVQGYSYEEIAGVLRCRVGTVKSKLNRARLRLRSIVDGRR